MHPLMKSFACALLALALRTSPANSVEVTPEPSSSVQTMTQSAEGRDWLRYIVRCALTSGKRLDVSSNDDTKDAVGVFGLAPDWSHAPLDEIGQRWVSACVLGFVNGLGEHVLVSMRGAAPSMRATVTDDERSHFDDQEAAFYGNIFSDTPTAYVCRGDSGRRQSASRAKRICSDPSERPGVSRCDMIITGNCRDVCTTFDPVDRFYSHCKGGGDVFDEVVTIFLPTDH